MEGENQQPAQRTKERRPANEQGGKRGEPESGSKDRNRNRRSGGGSNRKEPYRFDDHMEHVICLLVTHHLPQAFPVISRTELATMPPVEVARTGSSILLCDHQHEGPHLWPNGDEAP